MTIQVELAPQIEAALSVRAQAEGMSLDAYVRQVIEQAAGNEGAETFSLEEFEGALDELAQGSEQLPVLPPEAYGRESIYGDG